MAGTPLCHAPLRLHSQTTLRCPAARVAPHTPTTRAVEPSGSTAGLTRPLRQKAQAKTRGKEKTGGEGGIRTRGTVARTHAFQACSFSHSDTSPHVAFNHTRSFQTPSLAERVGFEPTVPRQGDNGFRDRPVRPLRHLSRRRPMGEGKV